LKSGEYAVELAEYALEIGEYALEIGVGQGGNPQFLAKINKNGPVIASSQSADACFQ
jgi:hypothetical protein